MSDNPVKDYQEALRAYDADPSRANKDALDDALRRKDKALKAEKERLIADPSLKFKAAKPINQDESEEYRAVCAELKEAKRLLAQAQEDNKRLRREYKENVLEKRRLYKEVIPALQAKKKALKKD